MSCRVKYEDPSAPLKLKRTQFLIVDERGNQTRFTAASSQEATSWVNDIRDAIDKLLELKKKQVGFGFFGGKLYEYLVLFVGTRNTFNKIIASSGFTLLYIEITSFHLGFSSLTLVPYSRLRPLVPIFFILTLGSYILVSSFSCITFTSNWAKLYIQVYFCIIPYHYIMIIVSKQRLLFVQVSCI